MKTVILCGGKGTRLREETEFKPKPLVEVGGKPILWHIMKMYSEYGHNHFVLALGYKGDMIKKYFMDYDWMANDFTLNLKDKSVILKNNNSKENWTIDFVDTGQEAMTALRLFRLRDYLKDEEDFMLTYGDGVADVNIDEVIKIHKEKGKILTITGIHPRSKYGVVKVRDDDVVEEFKEKPILNDFVNGGFMVLNKRIFEHLDQKNVMLVFGTLPLLAKRGEVVLHHHKGFWHCMDTYRDYLELNKMWDENPEWKIWDKNIKKVLITGGAGFIGSHLAKLLVDKGFDVSVLEKNTADSYRLKDIMREIKYYTVQDNDLNNVFSENRFDCVIHLATLYKKNNPTPAESREMQNVNVTFPTEILDLCCKYNVKHFLNTGSFFEYKFDSQEPLSEISEIEPYNLYAATKISFENNLKYYTKNNNLNAITLRLFAPYGEKDNPKLIDFLIKSAMKGEKVTMTKGEQQWSFTYVEDIAMAYLKALEYIVKMEEKYNVFNIGANNTASIKNVALAVEKASNRKIEADWGAKEYPENEILYAKCCNDKAKRLLDWNPQYNVEQGIAKTYNYYLKNYGNI